MSQGQEDIKNQDARDLTQIVRRIDLDSPQAKNNATEMRDNTGRRLKFNEG